MVDEVEELDPQEDRRADLEAAISSVEDADSTETVSESPDTPPSSPAGEEPVDGQEAPNLNDGEEGEERREARSRKQKSPAAPVGWTPDLKAQFSSLPEEVQKAIHGREVHINQVLQQSSDARRMSETLVRTIEPYRALMQAEGVDDPMVAVNGLLKTAATLSMGSQTQKAQRLAQLVNHYGIDIETLDKALAGSLPQNTEEDRLNQMVEQRMQPVNQLLNQFQQAQMNQVHQIQQQAVQSVGEMANDERFPHFDAVRGVMADFVDLAAQHGDSLTLEDAYHRACMSVPSIAQQVAQRQTSGFMNNQQNRVDSKRNAASSIHGRASSGQSGKPNFEEMSLRETIEAQISGSNSRI